MREDGDVQKKITRWASKAAVLGELFPGLAVSQRAESGAGSGGLVLVASLLTKTPNLGGEGRGLTRRSCALFIVSRESAFFGFQSENFWHAIIINMTCFLNLKPHLCN